MEIVDYLESERVVHEIYDNLITHVDLEEIRIVIATADKLGIKFYRKLEEL